MARSFYIRIPVFALAACILVSCGGRVPKPKTVQSKALSFFKHYGRKYETTRFANKNVDQITVNAIEEISKNTAYADAVVSLKDGHASRTLLKMEKHFPRGWKVISWEVLQEK